MAIICDNSSEKSVVVVRNLEVDSKVKIGWLLPEFFSNRQIAFWSSRVSVKWIKDSHLNDWFQYLKQTAGF